MKLHPYQIAARDFVLDRLYVQDAGGAGLFLDMGLGKTAVTLHAIKTLRDPPRVHTWLFFLAS